MSENTRMWIEVLFNVSYLVTIYWLVIAMIRRQDNVPTAQQAMTKLFIWAFGLLALGDTGHVGFRVIAYGLDGLDTTVNLFGQTVGLVGLGAVSTATTITFFYALILIVWHKRFEKPYGWFGILLFTAAAARLVIMTFPQNNWSQSIPPQGWSLARNLPLMLQGLGVTYLILRDAAKQRDRVFKRIGWMIIVSYTFYTPVILFVGAVPLLGMLMIPKTMAYVAIAWIGYTRLFPRTRPESAELSATTAGAR